ncbi:hypothetical protein HYH03_004445, partial [Edaphochlamys debaryana]
MPKRKAQQQLRREEEEEGGPLAAFLGDEGKDEGDDPSYADQRKSDDDGDEGEEEPDAEDTDSDDDGEGEGEDDDETSTSDEGGSDDSYPSGAEEDDGPESEDDEDGEAYKEVEMAFEFFDPQERDFLGLRALLGSYLDGGTYDVSGMSDAVIKQDAVGSVVKSGPEDDPFALLTAFNTTRGRHVGETWFKQVHDFVAARCPDEAAKAKFEKAWSAPGTALLVSERLINCPPQLAPPLLQFLMEEIEGAATDEDYPKEERDEFAFASYLHLTRVYQDPQDEEEEGGGEGAEEGEQGGAGPSGSRPAPAKAKGGKKGKEPVIVYVRPEDEYLHQVCSWSFTFPVEGRPVGRGDLVPLRCVMAVTPARLKEARMMMEMVVGNPRESAEMGLGAAAGAGAGNGGGKGAGKEGKGKAAEAGKEGKGGKAAGAKAAEAGGKGKGAEAGGKGKEAAKAGKGAGAGKGEGAGKGAVAPKGGAQGPAKASAQLSAFGVRQPISAVDSPQARLLHIVSQRSVELLGGMVVTSAGIALPDAAEKAIRALASTVLKTQVLEAAARQAAAVASALSPAAGGAGAAAAAAAAGAGPAAGAGAADAPAGAGARAGTAAGAGAAGAGAADAPAAADNVCLRTRAADVGACALLVNSLAVFAKRRQDKDLGRALLQALRASLLLDHLARLVLLLGPNLLPAPAALVQKQKGVMLWLGRAIGAVRAVPGLIGEPAPAEIVKTFGPSGCNALLLLGAFTLAMADLQPCGLPANMLLALPLDRSAAYPCLEVYALQASLLALKRDQESPQPTVPPRAALRLLLRALQLAAASVRPDARVPVERTPDGLLRIDMSWTNDRRVGTQTYGALLSKAQAILLAEVTVMHLNAVTARRPDAWIVEAPRLWALLLSAVRHLMEPDADAMQGKLMQLVVKLLDDATWPLQSRPGEGPSLILPPAQLLPSVVGVVAGGVVRSLETLLRCIADYPEGPEFQIISGLCQHLIPSKALGLMLIHTPPREAMAFINTLRKLLRRILPLAMLHAGLDSSTMCLMLACAIVELAMDATIADEARAEPSRAVDASTQRAPVFVLSYAMLTLLPELARIVRSMVTLMLMESVATRRQMMGAPGRTMVAGAVEVLTRMQWQAVAFTKQRYNGFAPKHRLAWVTGVHFTTSELLAVPMLG